MLNRNNLFKQNAIKSCAGILISALLFFSAGVQIPVLDTKADAYFNEAITKAGVSYATCRVINATVSIIKESRLELEPAGVGLSLAVGQILDPINDMTERLSDVLVMAITSLGVQELTYELSLTLAPPVFAFFLFVMSILLWFQNDRIIRLQKATMSILLFVGIARFCLPISSIANEFLHDNFFSDQIADANNELALGVADLDKLKDISLPEYDGFMEAIENSASFLKQKSIHFKDAIAVTVSNRGTIIENLLRLTFLYVGVFLIQVIILPLFIFWLLLKTINSLFYTKIPITVVHSREHE
ncbi:MAG: hypothetical protein KAI39_12225 [Desulfobulbaceae bacterium]|nr:hypothetical protein [Desulfobulbaceae bacterium]